MKKYRFPFGEAVLFMFNELFSAPETKIKTEALFFMRLKIFSLAFAAGFVFFFSIAAIYVYRFSGEASEEPEITENETPFLEESSAVFLLAFENGGEYGPFTLVSFDAKNGRIPIFTFSSGTAMTYSGVTLPAGKLFEEVSREIFAGTVESQLGVELSGYFIWNKSSAEEIILKTGSFDYILPGSLYYSDGTRYVNLAAGVQSMTGKKVFDIVTYPDFSEAERCDTVSRIFAAFFERRLRRFLPESGNIYTTIYKYTETDVTALDVGKYQELIKVLASGGNCVSSHVTNDVERDPESGLIYLSEGTKARVRKYFS